MTRRPINHHPQLYYFHLAHDINQHAQQFTQLNPNQDPNKSYLISIRNISHASWLPTLENYMDQRHKENVIPAMLGAFFGARETVRLRFIDTHKSKYRKRCSCVRAGRKAGTSMACGVNLVTRGKTRRESRASAKSRGHNDDNRGSSRFRNASFCETVFLFTACTSTFLGRKV